MSRRLTLCVLVAASAAARAGEEHTAPAAFMPPGAKEFSAAVLKPAFTSSAGCSGNEEVFVSYGPDRIAQGPLSCASASCPEASLPMPASGSARLTVRSAFTDNLTASLLDGRVISVGLAGVCTTASQPKFVCPDKTNAGPFDPQQGCNAGGRRREDAHAGVEVRSEGRRRGIRHVDGLSAHGIDELLQLHLQRTDVPLSSAQCACCIRELKVTDTQVVSEAQARGQ
jgi:hypothetical protein